MTEAVTLAIGGRRYEGWTSIEIERGIDRCVGSFSLEVSERWIGQDEPWRILPFSTCAVWIGDDVVMTGYVTDYDPAYDATSHRVRITGKSKTVDLVDCTPDIPSGQFSGYSVAAIARAIAALFGIEVVVETDQANQVVANTQLQRCETAFSFLERLGRLAGVLLCDDESGNLVLTNTGETRASGALIRGQNIKRATGRISADKRFSQYIVKGQTGLSAGGGGTYDGAGGEPTGIGAVQTQLRAAAVDTDVPRYRPRVTLAESQLTPEGMQLRANWQKQYAAGQATKATITLQGYRQPDGSLWRINQIVPVTDAWLGIDQDLLVVRTKYAVDDQLGEITELEVGPPSGYTPDPGEVKLRKHKGGRGGGVNWDGVVS